MAFFQALFSNKLLKGAALLSCGQATLFLSNFLRNIIIARHITTEQFGIAVTFSLALAAVESGGNLALSTLLVQDKDGDSPQMLGAVHFTLFIKGIIVGLLLYGLSEPIAVLFGHPEITWAFELLAIVPVIKGMANLELVVRQRKFDFLASSFAEALPQLISVLVGYIAVLILDDYRAMLVVVIFAVSLNVLFTHLLARRPYRWHISKALIEKNINFGWPMLFNGIFVFFLFQGDRLLIGTLYDMTTLGWYSAAFSICVTPVLLFGKVIGPLMMPLLSRSRSDQEEYIGHSRLLLNLCFAFSLFLVCFYVIGGEALLLLCFGEKYSAGAHLTAWLGIMCAMRALRMAPSVILTSLALTKYTLYSNIIRAIGLPLAFIAALVGKDLIWFAYCGILGEALALFGAMLLVPEHAGRYKLLNATLMRAGPMCLVIAFLMIFGDSIIDPSTNPGWNALLSGISIAVIAGATFLLPSYGTIFRLGRSSALRE